MTSDIFLRTVHKKLTKDNSGIIHSSDGAMYLFCSIDCTSKWYFFPTPESESAQEQQS